MRHEARGSRGRRRLARFPLRPRGGPGGGRRAGFPLRRPGDPRDLGGGRRALPGDGTRPRDDGRDRPAPDGLAGNGGRQRLGGPEVRGVGYRGVSGAVRHLAWMGAGDQPHRSRVAAGADARGHGGGLEPGHRRARRGGRGDPRRRGNPRGVRGVASRSAREVRAGLAAGGELPTAGQPGVVRPARDARPHGRGAGGPDRGLGRPLRERRHRGPPPAGSAGRRRGRRDHPVGMVRGLGRHQGLRDQPGADPGPGPELRGLRARLPACRERPGAGAAGGRAGGVPRRGAGLLPPSGRSRGVRNPRSS